MRIAPLVLAGAALAAPAVCSAYCFSIYDQQNRLVYQSQNSPIDLSLPISEGMAPRYPGQHLTMSSDASACREFDGSSPDINRLANARQASPDSLLGAMGSTYDNASSKDDYLGAARTNRSATGGATLRNRIAPAGRR
jgi:hypothetical protein